MEATKEKPKAPGLLVKRQDKKREPVTLATVTFDRLGGKKITNPQFAMSETELIKRYAAGSLVNQAKHFYEKQGMEIPDFNRMDRIEQLEKLEEYRQILKDSRESLKQHSNENKLKRDEKRKLREAEENKQKASGKSTDKFGGGGKAPPEE